MATKEEATKLDEYDFEGLDLENEVSYLDEKIPGEPMYDLRSMSGGQSDQRKPGTRMNKKSSSLTPALSTRKRSSEPPKDRSTPEKDDELTGGRSGKGKAKKSKRRTKIPVTIPRAKRPCTGHKKSDESKAAVPGHAKTPRKGPGRPGCEHKEVSDVKEINTGTMKGKCKDKCGSFLRLCEDCGQWANYNNFHRHYSICPGASVFNATAFSPISSPPPTRRTAK